MKGKGKHFICLDFTSSSPLSSNPVIKHAIAKTIVVETIVVVKATVTWGRKKQGQNDKTIKGRLHLHIKTKNEDTSCGPVSIKCEPSSGFII